MAAHPQHSHSWQGKRFQVAVPFTRAGVAHHVFIINGENLILVDAGDGVLRDLLSRNLAPERIDAVFFTHGHFDHMGGLHSLLGWLRMVGRRESLTIYIPAGCTEVLAAVAAFQACYEESMSFAVELVPLEPGQTVSVNEVKVKAFPVVHCGSIEGAEVLDPIPALGYRITVDEESIAVTGDTGNCPGLKQLIKGADLAIIEATYETSDGTSSDLLEKVHLSEDIARQLGNTAREFILVHKGRRS